MHAETVKNLDFLRFFTISSEKTKPKTMDEVIDITNESSSSDESSDGFSEVSGESDEDDGELSASEDEYDEDDGIIVDELHHQADDDASSLALPKDNGYKLDKEFCVASGYLSDDDGMIADDEGDALDDADRKIEEAMNKNKKQRIKM